MRNTAITSSIARKNEDKFSAGRNRRSCRTGAEQARAAQTQRWQTESEFRSSHRAYEIVIKRMLNTAFISYFMERAATPIRNQKLFRLSETACLLHELSSIKIGKHCSANVCYLANIKQQEPACRPE